MTMMVVVGSFTLNANVFGQTTDESPTCTNGADIISGNCSFAAGAGSEVDADNGTAFGSSSVTGEGSFGAANSDASGEYSVALSGATASGDGSTAGTGAEATGEKSTAFGLRSDASGDHSVVLGKDSEAAGTQSIAIGFGTKASSTFTNNHVIGAGVTPSTLLTNGVSNSLMIGYNSTIPTVFVEGAGGSGTLGRVGIGTTDPDGMLHIQDESNANTELIIERGASNSGLLRFHQVGASTGYWRQYSTGLMEIANEDEDANLRFNVNVGGTQTTVLTVAGIDGNFGVNTPTPGAPMDVRSTTGGSEEVVARFRVSDSSDEFFRILNRSNDANEFSAWLEGASDEADNTSIELTGRVLSNANSGTEPVVMFSARHITPATEITRPLFRWGTNTATSLMQMDNEGNLGIGTTTPDGRLDVNGTVFAQLTGGGVGSPMLYDNMTGEILEDNSTIRMKEEVINLEIIKEQVFALRPVSFRWKEACGGQNDIGLIAEEVEQAIPELAVYGYKRTFIGSDGELLRDSLGLPVVDSTQLEVRGVNYSKLALYLLGIVKQQDSLMLEMNEKLGELENAVQTCCSTGQQNKMETESDVVDNAEMSRQKLTQEYVLLKNDPNPFSDFTDIKYEAKDCTHCQIVIVDNQGRIIKRVSVTGDSGTIRIYSSEIGKGFFAYSIVRDGIAIGSSKMVSSQY